MASVASDGGTVRCLLIQAGDCLCAIPLTQLRRVVRALVTQPLPGSAPELLGLAEFAGEPLPILDLATLIGASPVATPAFPVTVIAWAGPPDRREAIGLAADAALELAELSVAQMTLAGDGVLQGDAVMAGRPARVLNLEALGAS